MSCHENTCNVMHGGSRCDCGASRPWRILAVDPDLKGAFAVVEYPGGPLGRAASVVPSQCLALVDSPVVAPFNLTGLAPSVGRLDVGRIRDTLAGLLTPGLVAVVEAPTLAAPGRIAIGVTHFLAGSWYGLLTGLGVRTYLAPPLLWQRQYFAPARTPRGLSAAERKAGIKARRDERKTTALRLAGELHPGLVSRLVKRDGRADCLLLAHWFHTVATSCGTTPPFPVLPGAFT